MKVCPVCSDEFQEVAVNCNRCGGVLDCPKPRCTYIDYYSRASAEGPPSRGAAGGATEGAPSLPDVSKLSGFQVLARSAMTLFVGSVLLLFLLISTGFIPPPGSR